MTPEEIKFLHNAGLRERSEAVTDTNSLVCFLYLLLRDHLNAGAVESMLLEIKEKHEVQPVHYTNGFLAKYAQDIAARLQ